MQQEQAEKCEGHVTNHQQYDLVLAASQSALNTVSSHIDQLSYTDAGSLSLDERLLKLQVMLHFSFYV